MEKHALYFPYMDVPANDWFSRVLLYWDTVGTILPASVVCDPAGLNAYTRSLLQAELLVAREPDYYYRELREMRDAFLQVIDADPAVPRKEDRDLDVLPTRRVHTGKLGWGIHADLVERGLARTVDSPEWEAWWQVEAHTADVFMTHLALTLASVDGLRMDR